MRKVLETRSSKADEKITDLEAIVKQAGLSATEAEKRSEEAGKYRNLLYENRSSEFSRIFLSPRAFDQLYSMHCFICSSAIDAD